MAMKIFSINNQFSKEKFSQSFLHVKKNFQYLSSTSEQTSANWRRISFNAPTIAFFRERYSP
jgi:hypothetical protein